MPGIGVPLRVKSTRMRGTIVARDPYSALDGNGGERGPWVLFEYEQPDGHQEWVPQASLEPVEENPTTGMVLSAGRSDLPSQMPLYRWAYGLQATAAVWMDVARPWARFYRAVN